MNLGILVDELLVGRCKHCISFRSVTCLSQELNAKKSVKTQKLFPR